MDKYVTIKKRSLASKATETTGKKSARYTPYKQPADSRAGNSDASLAAQSSSMINKHLLTTLSSESNPITHSDLPSRTDHIVSISTGHQVAESRARRSVYLGDRTRKLGQQHETPQTNGTVNILRGCCIYINGFLEGTTDIEAKRIVVLHGGEILTVASSRVTHIMTSQPLSGSKTDKILKSKAHLHVVKPEWLFDSVKAGHRLSEHNYRVIRDESTRSIRNMFKSSRSQGQP
ncbi:BRCT domain-containing protein [Fistulina hepatica ATCC 64428]|nr:BRCT domain-containing protein [Fistulina hepatica ATCC 64428]